MTAASKQALDDFARVVRVHATLALTKHLSHAKVDIGPSRRDFSAGTILHWVAKDHSANQIDNIPGVKNVRADLTNLPPNLGFDVWVVV